jgi:DNA-binding NarL/FixJ family response regulator
MVSVLVVDDHVQFRLTARDLVEATPGFEPLAEAASGEEALRMVENLEPMLVLLDVRLPGMNGIETARSITSLTPHPIVFLTSVDPPGDLPPGINSCGAATFVRKSDLRCGALQRLWQEHGESASRPAR